MANGEVASMAAVQRWLHDELMEVLKKVKPHTPTGGEQDFWTEAFAGRTLSINKTFFFQLHQLQLSHKDASSGSLALAPILDSTNESRHPVLLHLSACPKPSNLFVDEEHDEHWETLANENDTARGVDWASISSRYL